MSLVAWQSFVLLREYCITPPATVPVAHIVPHPYFCSDSVLLSHHDDVRARSLQVFLLNVLSFNSLDTTSMSHQLYDTHLSLTMKNRSYNCWKPV